MSEIYLLPQVMFQTVKKYPNKKAIIYNGVEITYAKLHEDILRMNKYLESRGVRHLSRVIIHSYDLYAVVILYWAALITGCTVSIFPPDIENDLLDKLIDDLDPDFMLGSSLSHEHELVYNRFKISKILVDQLSSLTSIENSDLLRNTNHSCQNSTDLAMIIYTSGSTGKPKGVMLTHDNMLSAIRSIQGYLHLLHNDIIYSILPLHFDYGLYQMLLSFHVGSTLILDNGMVHPRHFLATVQNYNVTILPILPNMISMLIRDNKQNTDVFSTVRKVTNTGEYLSIPLKKYIKQKFKNAELFLMYGLTECKRCSYIPPDMKNICENMIGKPIPNLSMLIVDQTGRQLQSYENGEIAIVSPTIMQGYWRDSALTNKKIIIDYYGRRLLLSGDRGYQDNDGNFYLTGRSDAVLKFNGEKFDCQSYLDKILALNSVLRCHLFIDKSHITLQVIIVCVEVSRDDISNKDLITQIKSCFIINHNPVYCYLQETFPKLLNGKVNFKLINQTTEKKTCMILPITYNHYLNIRH